MHHLHCVYLFQRLFSHRDMLIFFSFLNRLNRIDFRNHFKSCHLLHDCYQADSVYCSNFKHSFSNTACYLLCSYLCFLTFYMQTCAIRQKFIFFFFFIDFFTFRVRQLFCPGFVIEKCHVCISKCENGEKKCFFFFFFSTFNVNSYKA